jgi:hypothetical protein
MLELDIEARLAVVEAKEESAGVHRQLPLDRRPRREVQQPGGPRDEDAVMRNPTEVHTGQKAIRTYFTMFFPFSVTLRNARASYTRSARRQRWTR